jgi:hypothetical protein
MILLCHRSNVASDVWHRMRANGFNQVGFTHAWMGILPAVLSWYRGVLAATAKDREGGNIIHPQQAPGATCHLSTQEQLPMGQSKAHGARLAAPRILHIPTGEEYNFSVTAMTYLTSGRRQPSGPHGIVHYGLLCCASMNRPRHGSLAFSALLDKHPKQASTLGMASHGMGPEFCKRPACSSA